VARKIGASLIVAFAALIVVGNAVVDRFARSAPSVAAHVWPGHPEVQTALAMRDIAAAAGKGEPASADSLRMLQDVALKAPLSPEPFLAHGVAADLAGNARAAEAAFKAAKARDPRSLAARYFLAGLYLRKGELRQGLKEVAGFANLSPGGTAAVGPYVAAVAAKRSAWPQLRALFREDSAIEQATLTALASDPANLETLAALSGGRRKAADAPWIGTMIASLVGRGEYDRAHAFFLASLDPAPDSASLLFDPDFRGSDAPPPFNWTFASSSIGLAERQDGGRLHVIFYGQEDGVLAGQLLVLQPGSYRLSMRVSGGGTGSLAWTLRCANQPRDIASVPIAPQISERFQVPVNCPAQWIELSGRSGDVAQTTDLTVSGLSLTREAPGA
jgi:hypothetical protein